MSLKKMVHREELMDNLLIFFFSKKMQHFFYCFFFQVQEPEACTLRRVKKKEIKSKNIKIELKKKEEITITINYWLLNPFLLIIEMEGEKMMYYWWKKNNVL